MGGMPLEAGYPANFGILSVLSLPYAIALIGHECAIDNLAHTCYILKLKEVMNEETVDQET